MTPAALKALAEHGYMFREQFIDGNPELGLNGVRLTNVARIWETTYSIQIFDRQTCSLSQGGFTNDEHVSLTKHDGAEFLSWLRIAHPEILSEEVWSKLPEGPAFRDSAAGINAPKARLIQVCAEQLPELFGPGSLAVSGENFYNVLARVITRPLQVSQALTMRTILFLEQCAHDAYKTANQLLGAAKAAENPSRLQHARSAYELVAVAEHYRASAAVMRLDFKRTEPSYAADLPPHDFPEAIPKAEPWALVADSHGITERAAPILDESGASSGAAVDSPPMTEAEIMPGLLVVISDRNHPRYRQFGEVYCRVSKDPLRYALTFKDEAFAPHFNATQFRPIA